MCLDLDTSATRLGPQQLRYHRLRLRTLLFVIGTCAATPATVVLHDPEDVIVETLKGHTRTGIPDAEAELQIDAMLTVQHTNAQT